MSDQILGLAAREVRLLAGAYCALKGSNDVDYELMAKIVGMTRGSIQHAFPPIRNKAMKLAAKGQLPSTLSNAKQNKGRSSDKSEELGGAKPKKPAAKGGRKRKAKEDVDVEAEDGDEESLADGKTKPKGRGRAADKKIKQEALLEEGDEEAMNDNADMGDGLDEPI